MNAITNLRHSPKVKIRDWLNDYLAFQVRFGSMDYYNNEADLMHVCVLRVATICPLSPSPK